MGSTHTQTQEFKPLDKQKPSTPKKQVKHKDSVLFYLKIHPVLEKENENRKPDAVKKRVWNNIVNTVCSD